MQVTLQNIFIILLLITAVMFQIVAVFVGVYMILRDIERALNLSKRRHRIVKLLITKIHALVVKDPGLRKIFASTLFTEANKKDLEEKYQHRREVLRFVKDNPEYVDLPDEWLEQMVTPAPNSYYAVNKILDSYK